MKRKEGPPGPSFFIVKKFVIPGNLLSWKASIMKALVLLEKEFRRP